MKKEGVLKPVTVLVIFICAVAAAAVIAAIAMTSQDSSQIHDFDSCKAAGGQIMESYPEQCMIDGQSFMNDSQSNQIDPPDTSGFIGLSEEAALEKASQESIAARVVERDGEQLPVTMDYVFGRYNLLISDGKVYKVNVEGYAEDQPL